jgi:hypothetical protein
MLDYTPDKVIFRHYDTIDHDVYDRKFITGTIHNGSKANLKRWAMLNGLLNIMEDEDGLQGGRSLHVSYGSTKPGCNKRIAQMQYHPWLIVPPEELSVFIMPVRGNLFRHRVGFIIDSEWLKNRIRSIKKSYGLLDENIYNPHITVSVGTKIPAKLSKPNFAIVIIGEQTLPYVTKHVQEEISNRTSAYA